MKGVFKRSWPGMVIVAAVALGGGLGEVGAQTALSLTDAVTEALAKNPEIQTLQQRFQSASAKAKQAPYLEDPEIVFQLGGVPFSNPTSFNQSDTNSLGIRQKLTFFGKLGLKEKIAQQEVKIVEQELRAKEREIIAMVKMAYADLFMARRSVEILREQLEIMRSIIRATEARYQVGRVTQQDVFKALLEQSEIMNQLIVAEEDGSAAEVKLNTAMYRPPRTPIQVPADLTLPNGALSLAGIDEMALANRPELKGAEEEIARSERLYELAERNRRFPDFMVGWDYMRMPTEMKKERYGAMVNITIPFSPWTIGRRNYEVEETLAEIRAARTNRDAMRNMTLRAVGESQARVQAARRSVQLYRDGLLSQAELSFRSALTAYQTGRVEFVTLLEAQRALREARMGYYKATAGFLQNLADLERVVGKELP
ncbi:MAG TPA: TolC family protein [Candidatus Binatia bacterium]|nr:TolC family protein [Candidatus Binatia bacterium]